MRLDRTDETFSYSYAGKVHVGQRGMLVLGRLAFCTVENYESLKLSLGEYECEFAMWTAHSGRRAQAIRIILSELQFLQIYGDEAEKTRRMYGQRAKGRIYIHPANYPHELAGCIAPGIRAGAEGVAHSQRALDQIFASYGGWVEGRRLPGGLVVA